MIAYRVDQRDSETAHEFVGDLADRLANRVQLTTDGLSSPAVCLGAQKEWIMGKPDFDRVSTSHVERQNLTMRMQMRRFTRLTTAFSKKVEFHLYAVALHFTFYNYCRPHQTLTRRTGVSRRPRQWRQDWRTGFGPLRTF